MRARPPAADRDFAALWIAQTANQVGTQVSLFVVPLVAFALTGSPLVAGLAGGADLVGTALGLLPGGLLADRVDGRRALRTGFAVGAGGYAAVAVAGALGVLTVTELALAAFLTGFVGGVLTPIETVLVRAVVPADDLPRALARLQARQHVASLVGGPVGGALLSLARWAPFLLDAVTYVVAWVLIGRLRSRPVAAARDARQRTSRGSDVTEGLRVVMRHPLFRTLLIWGACSNLVVNALFVAAELRLLAAGFPAWSIGLVGTAAGVAGVLGSAAAPAVIERVATGRLTVAVAWSFVPLLVPVVLWNQPVVVAAALALGVLLNPIGNAGIGAYRQALTPPDLLGRVSAASSLASWSTMPLAPLLAGSLLTALGGTRAMTVLAVLNAAVALIPTLSHTVRAVPRPAQWAVPAGVD